MLKTKDHHLKNKFTDIAVNSLFNHDPKLSAKKVLNNKQKICFLTSSLLIFFAIITFTNATILVILLLLNVIYFFAITIKNTLFFRGLLAKTDIVREDCNFDDLPIYTILIPLFREGKVVNKLTKRAC